MNSTKHAGQGFGQRGALIVHRVRHFQHIFHDDAAGDAHVIGVGAVVEQQVVAKIFLATAAVIAAQTRRGIRGDNAHADPPAWIHPLADGRDLADQLVAKDGRRLNHFRVIAALPDFEVGTVGKRQPDAHQDFVGGQSGHVDFFNAKIFAAIQHRRGHLRGHRGVGYGSFHFFAYFQLLWRRRAHACVIKILSDSAVGLAARSSASWILANGKRCVTISMTGSFFFSTRSAPSSWMSTAAL